MTENYNKVFKTDRLRKFMRKEVFIFITVVGFILILTVSSVYAIEGGLRKEVDERQTARVACTNSGEAIQTIEAYYYCSNNVQVGVFCPLPESQILNKLSSYSFTFTNANCGQDPCLHVSKKGILIIECGSVRTTSGVNVPTSSQTNPTGNQSSGGFVGFVRNIISEITTILRPNSSQAGTAPQVASQTEEESVIDAVLNNDLDTIKAASKPLSLFAIDQYAVQNEDISVCDEGTPDCAQKTLFFACSDSENEDLCKFDIMNEMRRVDGLNSVQGGNKFLNEERIYIRYDETRATPKVKKFKFENSNVKEGLCEIRVQKDSTDGSHYGYYEYPLGTVVPSRGVRLNTKSSSVRATDVLDSGFSKTFPWEIVRDCNSRDCALLDEDVVAPKGDLLCGLDERWYLCEGFGVQNFNDGEQYFCDNGIWTRIIQRNEISG